jgi:hypothetical protein
MNKAQLLILFLLFSYSTFSQDNLGIAGSTRAPINTVWNNPSTIVDSRAFIDFQLAGINAFVKNDLVYLRGGQLSIANFDTAEPSSLPKASRCRFLISSESNAVASRIFIEFPKMLTKWG